MDFALPSMNGAMATRLIRKALPDVEVLMLSMHEEPSTFAPAWMRGRADTC